MPGRGSPDLSQAPFCCPTLYPVWVPTRFLETEALSTHCPVPTSHRSMVLSREPVHSCDESSETMTRRWSIWWAWDRAFQKGGKRFTLPGLTANPVTTMAWPQNCCLGCEESCKSHIMTILSREALKNWFDLWIQAICSRKKSSDVLVWLDFKMGKSHGIKVLEPVVLCLVQNMLFLAGKYHISCYGTVADA